MERVNEAPNGIDSHPDSENWSLMEITLILSVFPAHT